MNNTEDIIIVGGGPVGLFMGICLYHHGIACTILEQRTELVKESRSLGIHPVSLELFEKLGIVEDFLSAGIKVQKGIASDGTLELGEISFKDSLPPYNHILINPQFETERILRDHFIELAPQGLIQGARVIDISHNQDEVSVSFVKDEVKHEIFGAYLIGCDGKNSIVRESAGIRFKGKKYPDTYIMGDFDDSTRYDNDAVVYLTKEGLVECFPLPGKKRRWVVKTDEFISEPTPQLLADLVHKRTNHTIPLVSNTMTSGFGVQHYLAETFVKQRILLAGDSAHVVSPIGGQGMNLGWLDAWELASILSYCRGLSRHQPISDLFAYSTKQKSIAKKVARRAEINMRLGRKSNFQPLKKLFLKTVLKPSTNKKLAELFTMRGLESWWI